MNFVLLRKMLPAVAAAILAGAAAAATEKIEPPEAFVAEAFEGPVPTQQALWLTPQIRKEVARILGHRLTALRQRYWRQGERTAWILEEIGKEEPITAGFVVDGGRIASAHVLVYRESRGWEIRYPYFRDQFAGAGLDERLELDTDIDGISGATLSVRAMSKMARLALYFHRLVLEPAKE